MRPKVEGSGTSEGLVIGGGVEEPEDPEDPEDPEEPEVVEVPEDPEVVGGGLIRGLDPGPGSTMVGLVPKFPPFDSAVKREKLGRSSKRKSPN